MKERLVSLVSILAVATVLSACNRPDTAYNNSGASAMPGSTVVTLPATATTTTTTADTAVTTAPVGPATSPMPAPTATTTVTEPTK